MTFERFTKTRGRAYTPKASIWSRGQLGFNQGAIEKFNLKDYDYAVLFYDREAKKIGVKFTNDNSEEGVVKVVRRPTGGASISAKAFLVHYEIAHSETKKYDVEYDRDNDLYVITLR